MEIPEGREMECLLDVLKDHFRNAKTVGTANEQKAIFKKQLEEHSGKTIDDNLMDIAAKMQMVQPVALLPGEGDELGTHQLLRGRPGHQQGLASQHPRVRHRQRVRCVI